jgi:hypothetical protein
MSKDLARGPESYRNEELALELVPVLLGAKGFEAVRTRRPAGMKFIEACDVRGDRVTFWLKQGWSTTERYSAVQFGMFDQVRNPAALSNSVFVDFVAARTRNAKARGASHVLLIHMYKEKIRNYAVLTIDDLPRAYARQIDRWPTRARNTKTPTLYFEDNRATIDAACTIAVTELEMPLEAVAGLPTDPPSTTTRLGSNKVTAEIERRFQQQAFRLRVGNRCGWRCMVSGTSIREVLDAAHLPGRDWRIDNGASDGILIRADLHRLLDQGLARIENGRFLISVPARVGEYANYHNRTVAPMSGETHK